MKFKELEKGKTSEVEKNIQSIGKKKIYLKKV